MKLPSINSLKKRGGGNILKKRGGDSGGPPQIVADLYRDLRDRHLLPVVILLVVGIAAIPLVLGGGSSNVAPPSPSAVQVSSELALQAKPAVLVESPGLRDYRIRLRAFREKNPFVPQLTGTDSALSPTGAAAQTLSDLTASSSSALTSPTSTGVSTSGSSSVPSIPSFSGGGGSGGSGGGGSGGGSGGGTKTQTKYFEYRVDIEFNAESQPTRLRRGVKTLVLLPSEERPVISFVGATEGGKEAVFLVSPYAGVQGGSCVPSAQNCFFLTLSTKEGESTAFLDYTDPDTNDHTTYKLKLKRIKRVFIKL